MIPSNIGQAFLGGAPIPQEDTSWYPPHLTSLLSNPRVQNNPAISGPLGALLEHHEAANSPAPLDPSGATEAARGVIRKGERKAVAANEETKAAAEDSLQSGLRAVDSQEAQDTAVANLQAPEARKAIAADEEAQKKFAEDRAKIEADITTAKNGYMAAVDDLKNTKVHSWWSTAGTGATILGIISQTLAGGLQGMGGGAGPTPLDRVIDQDMQRQRLEFEKKSKVADASQNLYSQLMTQLKDRTLAESAFRQIAYNSTTERMKNLAITLGGGQAKANADKAEASILQKNTEILAGANAHISNTRLEAGKAEAEAIMKGANLVGENDRAAMAANAKGEGKGPMMGLAGVPGSDTILAAIKNTQGPEAARGLVDRWNAATHIGSNAKNISSLLRSQNEVSKDGVKSGTSLPFAEFSARIDQNLSQIKNDLAVVGHLGAISADDQKLVEAIAGLKGGWVSLLTNKINPYGRDPEQLAAALDRLSAASKSRVRTELNSVSVGGQSLQLAGAE